MAAELVVLEGNHRGNFVRIAAAPVTVGRAKTADLPLPDDGKVSNIHARITPSGADRYLLEDLGSTNGTFVNDERIEQTPLRSGDLVKIGRSLMIFRTDAASGVPLDSVELVGGGSSADIRPASAPAGLAEAAPAPGGGAEAPDLADVVLAAAAPDLVGALQRATEAAARAAGVRRAVVFLTHPLTGGLGRAAVWARPGADPEAPVDANLLKRAAAGDVSGVGGAAAAPVPLRAAAAGGPAAGVVYVDGLDGATGAAVRAVTATGIVVGLLVEGERARRLSDAATEVVALASERIGRQPVDVVALLAGVDRVFAGAARARGLVWRVEAAHGLLALADPALLQRGLDRLVEATMTVARGEVLVRAVAAERGVRVTVQRRRIEPPEAVLAHLDVEGVAADLRRCQRTGQDAGLVVARAALLRAGGRFVVRHEEPWVSFALDLEAASPPGAGL